MPARGRKNASEDACPWDIPKPPQRPHQLPYSPVVAKKGVDVYILRMNRDVNRMQMQRGLFRLLRDHVLIYHLSVEVDMFGSVNGHIVVPSRSDIRDIVQRFHRASFYGRTLEFCETDPNIPIPVAYKKAVIKLFEERKKSRLLLAELMRLFEDEYDQSLGVLDIMKMPDVVERYTDGGTQMIRLLPTAMSFRANLASMGCLDVLQVAHCTMDCCRGGNLGHAARSGGFRSMVCYRVLLREFAPRVRKLLHMHQGNMPVSSFVTCYESHFGPLEEDETGGIFLEHLLCSVDGVGFQQLSYQSRKIVLRQWKDENEQHSIGERGEYRRFCREIFNMLTLQRGCALSFSQFVQTYRMVYGKACRVADFGCTRLVDLLSLFPETMHVIGTGIHRILTLTHAAQKRRFKRALDQITEQSKVSSITINNFDSLYKFTFKNNFVPVDFGVCFVEDLLLDTTHLDLDSGPSTTLSTEAEPLLETSMLALDDSSGFESKFGMNRQVIGGIEACEVDGALKKPEKPPYSPVAYADDWQSLSDSSSEGGNLSGDSSCYLSSDEVVESSSVKPVSTRGMISSRLALRFC